MGSFTTGKEELPLGAPNYSPLEGQPRLMKEGLRLMKEGLRFATEGRVLVRHSGVCRNDVKRRGAGKVGCSRRDRRLRLSSYHHGEHSGGRTTHGGLSLRSANTEEVAVPARGRPYEPITTSLSRAGGRRAKKSPRFPEEARRKGCRIP